MSTAKGLAFLAETLRSPFHVELISDARRHIADALDRLAAYERPIEGIEEVEQRHADTERRIKEYEQISDDATSKASYEERWNANTDRSALVAKRGGRSHRDRGILLAALRRERALREEAEKQAERDVAICEALRKMNAEAEERAERAVRELARLHSLIRALQQAAAKEAAATTTEDRNRAHGEVITALGPLLMVKTGDGQ